MELDNKADNTTVEENAVTTAENPATSQNDTGATAASATEQNTAPVQQDNATQTAAAAEDDVTKTQAFAARLKESTEKVRAEVKAEIEKEYAAKTATPEVRLTREEKTALRTQKVQRANELIAQGTEAPLAYQMAKDEMDEQSDNLLDSKREVAQQEAERKAALEAERTGKETLEQKVKDLETKLAKFEATKKVKESNDKAAAASTGSLGGEPAADADYISSEDWDKAKPEVKEKWYKNPKKLMEVMAKWGK